MSVTSSIVVIFREVIQPDKTMRFFFAVAIKLKNSSLDIIPPNFLSVYVM